MKRDVSIADRIRESSKKATPLLRETDDPLAAIVFAEMAARLPEPIRAVFRKARNPNVAGWLAAGAVYQYVGDPEHQRRFLDRIDRQDVIEDPGHIAAEFGGTWAQFAPPIRTDSWYQRDLQGVFWAALVLLATLGVRVTILWLAAYFTLPPAESWYDYFSVIGLPILVGSLKPGIISCAILLALIFWFAIEALLPRFAERARRQPLKRANLPIGVSWRLDTCTVLFVANSLILMAGFTIRLALLVYDCCSGFAGHLPSYGITFWLIGSLVVSGWMPLLRSSWHTIRLPST